jgi:predicted RNA-binding Zn ribbon-like protein
VEPRLPFEYIAGNPALDFVNTVSWRQAGLRHERFRVYEDLVDWARQGRLISTALAASLRREARVDPTSAQREVPRAIRVRALLHRVFLAIGAGRRVSTADLRRFNSLLARATRGLALARGRSTFHWEPRTSIVNEVIWRAAQFLTTGEPARLGACANADCGWMFLDRSRRSNRRWCAMDKCGSQAKSRRYYRRKNARR